MKKIVVSLLLVGAMGCRTINAVKVASVKDEVAILTSIALLNPNLTPDQVAKIQKDGALLSAHIDEVVK